MVNVDPYMHTFSDLMGINMCFFPPVLKNTGHVVASVASCGITMRLSQEMGIDMETMKKNPDFVEARKNFSMSTCHARKKDRAR